MVRGCYHQSFSYPDKRQHGFKPIAFQGAIASELVIARCIVELKQKIDYEKAQFKKHMAKLNVEDIQNFQTMMHE